MVRKLAEEQRGIVLVTGTTGSGKSTTLAAMIDHINRTRANHIVTLEDPIEYLHEDKSSIVNQREVGADTKSFGRAMRRVLRQDPDVILIGEMRDEETVRTALSAAETGHLVFSTVHTLDATETINRIIDFFPPHLQHQARVMLASTLKGAIAQRLVPDITGEGRVPASEILVVTGRVQDLILNPEETGKITEVIAEGEYYGMRTFDQALLKYTMEGKISEAVAMDYASSPHDFKLMLAAGGERASGIEQLQERDGGPDEGQTQQRPDGTRSGLSSFCSSLGFVIFTQMGKGGEEEEAAPTEATVSVEGTEASGTAVGATPGEAVEGAVEAALERPCRRHPPSRAVTAAAAARPGRSRLQGGQDGRPAARPRRRDRRPPGREVDPGARSRSPTPPSSSSRPSRSPATARSPSASKSSRCRR